MPRYQYKALLETGESVSGEIEAANERSVVDRLEAVRQHALEVRLASDELRLGGMGWRRRPSAADITLFTRELAWLLRAGLNLSRALEMLAAEFATSRLGPVLSDVHVRIRAGESLHDALLKHQGIFSDYFIAMIGVAESSGTLPVVMERMADAREREASGRQKIISSLLYPGTILCVATGAILFILTGVVPKLKDMFDDPSAHVPGPARRLIAVSDWLIGNGWLLTVAFIVASLAIAAVVRNRKTRHLAYETALRIPLVGRVLGLSLVAQFCRTLGLLLGAGVELSSALDLVRQAFQARELDRIVNEMTIALRKGEDFLKPVEASHLFPALVPRLLRVGVETGNLVPALNQLSLMFEEKVDVNIQRLTTLMEPAIILVLSGVVGSIIAIVMQAIISVNDLAM